MEKRIGIIMNGVTGRMGSNQHLTRSILAIRNDGGVAMKDGSVLMPEPLLIGRNEAKLRAMAERHGGLQWSTDLGAALQNKTPTRRAKRNISPLLSAMRIAN